MDRRLAVLLLSGRVGPNTRVWREGFPGPCDDGKSWVPVAALLGVQPKWFTEADAVLKMAQDFRCFRRNPASISFLTMWA